MTRRRIGSQRFTFSPSDPEAIGLLPSTMSSNGFNFLVQTPGQGVYQVQLGVALEAAASTNRPGTDAFDTIKPCSGGGRAPVLRLLASPALIRRRVMKSLTYLGALVLLLAATPASADSIAINGGSLQMSPVSGPLVLEGDRGFTFGSGVSVSGGIFAPWLQCTGLLNCLPGGTVDLSGFWSGNDAVGTATLDGVTFRSVGSLSATTSMTVHFFGTATLPDLAPSAVLSAPFAFDGAFRHPNVESLFGGGMATLRLSQDRGFPDRWHLDSARYEFTPTPEPTAGLLLLVGIPLVERMRRRRA